MSERLIAAAWNHSWPAVALLVVLSVVGLILRHGQPMLQLVFDQFNYRRDRSSDARARRHIAIETGDSSILPTSSPDPVYLTVRSGRSQDRHRRPRGDHVRGSAGLPLIDQVAAVPVRGPVERGGE